MVGIKHATKRRFAKSTTSKRSIKTGISAEYTEYRTKLERVVTAIKSLIKQIQATSQVWSQVAKHQKTFAGALLAALPVDGLVRSQAREVEDTMRNLQRLIVDDGGESAPHRRITAVLETYLKHIESIQADYPEVETSYTEVSRYQKKVDKLTKKGDKKNVTLKRNVDKLTTARSEHDSKLAAIIARMRPAFDKHEAVFQCAHHAFWIAQEKYSHIVNDTTKNIRWESMAVREHLVNIDVNKSPRLPPIGRVQMIMPGDSPSEIPAAPIVEFPTSVAATAPSAVVVVPSTPQPQSQPHALHPSQPASVQHEGSVPVQHSAVLPVSYESVPAVKQPAVRIAPEPPVVQVAKQPTQQIATVQSIESSNDIAKIPAVPTEKPQLPVPRKRSEQEAEPAFVGAY